MSIDVSVADAKNVVVEVYVTMVVTVIVVLNVEDQKHVNIISNLNVSLWVLQSMKATV